MPDPAATPAAAPSTPAVEGLDPNPRNAQQEGADAQASGAAVEVGGRGGPDPTRYGDWEKNGRCIDF